MTLPVFVRLEDTVGRNRLRPEIVGEGHSVADEDFIFDGDSLTDENVA